MKVRNRRRRGVSLTDVVIGLGIAALLLAALVPARELASEQANRAKCSNNLRQIALAATMYANQEARTPQTFPRTVWDTTSTAVIADTTGYGVKDSFSPAVGKNNVTASFFLILKTQDLLPGIFVCPSTRLLPGFQPNTGALAKEDSSNWRSIQQNLGYSYACPFGPPQAANTPTTAPASLSAPTTASVAAQAGWSWDLSQLTASDPLAADINPGGQAVSTISYDSPQALLAKANSPNHFGAGQNVAYCDGHVEFQQTPFCGAPILDSSGKSLPFQDNIYTALATSPRADGSGGVLNHTPGMRGDTIMLPVAGQGYLVGTGSILGGILSAGPAVLSLVGIGIFLIAAIIVVALVMGARRKQNLSEGSSDGDMGPG